MIFISRTRDRWAKKRSEEFNEVKTDVSDHMFDDFEDAYPEFYNSVTQLQKDLTDSVLKEDKIDTLIQQPMSNVDDFIKLASTMVQDGKDQEKISKHKKEKTLNVTSIKKEMDLQTFIIIIRDSMLIFLLMKILIYGFNF